MTPYNVFMAKQAMDKEALTAAKARALAKSVGIIPHPDSQWKWALRQLRAKNPEAVRGAPLMLEGRELGEAKERIGLLPNNLRQRIRSLARRQREGIEVGAGTYKDMPPKYVVGGVGHIPDSSLREHNIDLKDLAAHTHPRSNWYRWAGKGKIKSISGNLRPKDTRLQDPVLMSSPSGIDYGYSYRRHHNAYKQHLKNPHDEHLARRVDRMNPRLTGDAKFLALRRRSHNIIGPTATGVHKFRVKAPNLVRSVYFEGGLD